jgi:Ca2+-binding EF-hand superfamily protein
LFEHQEFIMARPLAVGLVALAAILFVCLVRAEEEPPLLEGSNPETLFKQLDANGDGQLAVDEAGEDHRRLFQRLVRRQDSDGNGKLSLSEFMAGLKEAPAEIPADEPQGAEPNEQLTRFLQADPTELFKLLDANGNGKLVLDEVPADRRPQFGPFFERADVDRDKALTLDEFRKGHEQVRQYLGTPAPGQVQAETRQGGPDQRLYRALDLDGDGELSAEEIAKAPLSLAKLDHDGDGALSRGELGQGAQAPQAPPGNGKGPGRPNGPGLATFNPERLIERMDKDGDGKLKQGEMPPFLRGRFAQIDANGDGFADLEELRHVADQMQRRAKQGGEENKPKKPAQEG